MKLNSIFIQNGCDKGTKHTYSKVYEKDMEKVRNEKINLCEIGIFKGASIAAWLDYFPNATIYGVDTFQRINPEDIEVLQNPRVKWLAADSLKAGVGIKIQKEWGDVKFDFMIDDGLHTPEANALTFQNFSPFLKEHGIYYVEDAWPLDIMTMDEMDIDWIKSRSDRYNMLKMNTFFSSIKDFKYKRFDLRKDRGIPDSYIFRVQK